MKTPLGGFSVSPISRAVAAAVAATPALVSAQTSGNNPQSETLEEIIVTATKREASMQHVPMSIEAFSADQISRMGLVNMSDVINAVPSLSTVTTSPGRNEVVFRGVSTGSGEWRTDSGSAVYFGDTPMTSATQAVDPRSIDIARIEALPGPQGTLFGSSSQSGALRYIPNSPDHSSGYGDVTVRANFMEEGDPGYDLEGFVNIPLIDDRLTMRLALFDVEEGGWIDNVYGQNIFTTDDNADVVEENFNTWSQSGGRVSVLWSINDAWDVEGMYMNQSQTSEGDWSSDPNSPGLGDLDIVRFHKDRRDDDWWLSSLTITGDLGFAEFKSVTSYLDREIFYEFDGNVDGQIRAQRVLTPGDYLYYNILYSTGFNPETSINDQTAERVTQEFRLASTGDSKWQWMVGAFYESTEDAWVYDFSYIDNLAATPFGVYWQLYYETYVPNTNSWYRETYSAKTDQVAVFGELNYQITDRVSATVGARWFEYDRDRYEFKEWPEGNPYETDIYQGKSDDTVFKFALDYSFDDDMMVYALYSEGFRLGGFNSIKNPGSILPDTYGPDELTNVEVGFKSEWLGNRLRWNITAYQMQWEGIQRGITDPEDWTANATVNMGDADINGVETSLNFQVTDNFRIDASYAWNGTELEEDVWLSDLLPGLDPGSDDQLGAKGQELAIGPEHKWRIGAEYNMPNLFSDMNFWIRYDHWGASERYHDWWNAMNAQTGNGGRKLLPSVDEANLQFSLYKQTWELTLSIWNVWDARNPQWISSGYDWAFGPEGQWSSVGRYVNMPGFNRPRQYQLTFRKDFSW